MSRKNLQLPFKILVSAVFLFFVLKRVDTAGLIETLRECHLPLAAVSIIMVVLLTFPNALRWMILLKSRVKSERISLMNLWKLTMVGILFNNFLPTGAGGDIAKAFYLVKGEKQKLLIGGSVLVDRFVGAFTVITMGVVAALLTPQVPGRTKILVSAILAVLLSVLLFFSNKRLASILYGLSKNILPEKARISMNNIYGVFNSYFSAGRLLLLAAGLSFITQSIAVLANYLMGISLLWGSPDIPNLSLFFIYIPLIWTSTLIPSLGGLGIREFTYVYFFASHMGQEKAFALSMLFLITIVIQSCIGAVIMLFLKTGPRPEAGRTDNP